MSLEGALGVPAMLLYLTGSVAHHAHLFAGSERARRVAPWLVLTGVLFHTAAIGAHCLASSTSLFRDPSMPLSLAAYFIAVAQVAVDFWKGWSSAGSLSVPLAFVALCSARVQGELGGPARPPG
ncbi:MAG: hypothetical protein FJX77_01320, partial [Armatimonadetes bacterium]|nr:hypothetical protein [Armatimonadota bacterium]